MQIIIAEQNPSIFWLLYWMLKLAGYGEALRIDHWQLCQLDMSDVELILLDLSLANWQDRSKVIASCEEQWHKYQRDGPLQLVTMTTIHFESKWIDGYPLIQKPFHVHELLGAIERMKVMEVL